MTPMTLTAEGSGFISMRLGWNMQIMDYDTLAFAEPESGAEFVCWVDASGNEVSTSAEFNFGEYLNDEASSVAFTARFAAAPSETPTENPTELPTETPTEIPTEAPSAAPSETPNPAVPSTGAGTAAAAGFALILIGIAGFCIKKRTSCLD